MFKTLLLVLGGLAVSTATMAQSVREVTYSDQAVISIKTQVRFTTVLVLPDDEDILDFVCGDKDFWVVNGADHLAYVKPSKEKAATSLNLVTASGRVYSFLLRESTEPPDLKVYVTNDASRSKPTSTGSRRFYRAEEVNALRAQLESLATREADRYALAERQMEERIAAERQATPARFRFPYRWKKDVAPFHVEAIFHDGASTYLRTRATELPVLYELKDGEPSLVNFDVREGLYVVPKVVTQGYLAVGKKKLPFVAWPEAR